MSWKIGRMCKYVWHITHTIHVYMQMQMQMQIYSLKMQSMQFWIIFCVVNGSESMFDMESTDKRNTKRKSIWCEMMSECTDRAIEWRWREKHSKCQNNLITSRVLHWTYIILKSLAHTKCTHHILHTFFILRLRTFISWSFTIHYTILFQLMNEKKKTAHFSSL